jgi:hypothetical protein
MVDNVIERSILVDGHGQGPMANCTCTCYCRCTCACTCYIFSVVGTRDNEADYQVVTPQDHGTSAGVSGAAA